MKKSIFTTFCTLLCSVTLFAQPDTLTVSTTVQSKLTGSDIRTMVNLDSTASLPSFAPATGGTWNLKDVVYDSVSKVINRYTAIAPYTYFDSIGFQFDSLRYMVKGANLYVTSGIQQYSQFIDTQTVIKIKPSGVGDTIAFPFQTNQYTHEYIKLPLPLTYTSSPLATWSSSFIYKTGFNFTDRELSLVKAKSTIYTTFSEADTVVGWGTVLLKTHDYPSLEMKVLQVKTVVTKKDSIALPNALGVYDSAGLDTVYYTNTYTMNFYKQDALLPLVTVTYYDADYDSVVAVEVGTSDAIKVGIASVVANASGIKVYPNPVTNGNLNIEVPDAKGTWSYQLINVVGQQIAGNVLSLGNGSTHTQVSLSNVTPGVYYVRLINNNEVADVRSVVVQ